MDDQAVPWVLLILEMTLLSKALNVDQEACLRHLDPEVAYELSTTLGNRALNSNPALAAVGLTWAMCLPFLRLFPYFHTMQER